MRVQRTRTKQLRALLTTTLTIAQWHPIQFQEVRSACSHVRSITNLIS